MKKFAFFCLAALTVGLYSCKKESTKVDSVEETPAIALEKGLEEANAVTFTVTTSNAKSAAYMLLDDDADAPSIDVIFEQGKSVTLGEDGKAEVRVDGLDAETDYRIVAAAKNVTKVAGSNTLYVTTTAASVLMLDVEIVQYDHEKMNFRVTSQNADRIAYLVLYASKETPEASYVLLNGDEVEVGSKESVEVTGLEHAKEYQLVVVAEGNGTTLMADPLLFTTDDDPSNVISHEYTRARGTKWGSSYFMMFSFEDANEADNFAYNEKTLSLDFYADPNKDYLPAGTYEVKESNEPDCVSSYRYSTYGYDNGVGISSGRVIVDIDDDTKAYSFDIDIYLKDGRHLQAIYNGDVDNMPVIDIVTVTTTFTTANATTSDEGENWTLTLSDEAGNSALFNLANAFKAPYIAANSYTISSSAEEFAVRPMAVDTGQFDGATSHFLLAGETEPCQFVTGTLHVSVDWELQTYQLTFYGTLANNYLIEAEYEGAIGGVSLEQLDEIIDVMLDTATASSYDNNTNWYLTFAKQEDGVEKYRLVLDAYCPAMSYLPAGYYELGNAIDGRSLGTTGTLLYVAGEGQYLPVEARANVSIDMAAKTYTFDVAFKIEDGRTFKFAYVGEVSGMEIVNADDTPTDIEWTTLTAKWWYSDNWQLVIESADAAYTIEFDMRVGDSSLTYIPSGTYTLDTSNAQYIDFNYSKFDGSAKAFTSATLVLTYYDDTKLYDVSFDVTLTDDRNFAGTYHGAITGSPKE